MTVQPKASDYVPATENQGFTLALGREASWHRICFIDLGEPPAMATQGC
jgi:hypothetical protein